MKKPLINVGDEFVANFNMMDYDTHTVVPAGTIARVIGTTLDTQFGWAVVKFDYEGTTEKGVLMYLVGDQSAFSRKVR